MQDENQKSNPQPTPRQGSLAHSGKTIQPLASHIANTELSPTANPNIAPFQHANNTAPSNFNPTGAYPDATQTTQPSAKYSASTDPNTAMSGNGAFLTGSQMQQQKVPLPIGIYFIAGFNLVGFAIGFFDTSQNSAIYTIVMFLNLLLAVGLILRLELARKFILWLLGMTLVLTIVSLFLLVGLQQRLQTLKTNYDDAISRIDQSKLSITQKQQLDTIQAAITGKEKLAGKAITFTYIKLGATAVETIVVMVYLTRPKVKEVFRELEA